MAQLERQDLSVYIAPQAVEGVADAAPAFKVIRGTSGIVQSTPTYVTSNEVVTDGQAAQQVQDRRESTFTREFDVSKETVTIFNDVVHGVPVDNTVTASTIGTDALGFVSTADAFAGLGVGDWFKASGFADTDLNVLFKITVKADDNNIETAEAPASIEAAGASVTLTSVKTSSGITKTLRTIQNRVADTSKVGNIDYETFIDCFAATGSLSADKSGIVTGSAEWKTPTPLSGTAKLSGQTADLAKDTSDVVSAVNNISALYENGVNSQCNIQVMSLEFNNNYEGDGGAAGCIDEKFGRGTISVTGSLTTRTVKSDSMVWRNKNKQGTRQSIAIGFKWPDGDWAIMEVTKAVITSHTFTDSDIIVSNEMEFAGDPDSVTGSTFQIFSSF